MIEFVDFDYHAQMKASKDSINILRRKLIPFIERCEFYQAIDGRPLRFNNFPTLCSFLLLGRKKA